MDSVYSVGQVNSYIRNMFTQDFMLNHLFVRGEVSNCKYHTSGHIYFSLKDATGVMNCVMFAGQRRGLAFSMKNGDKVIVEGSVSVYERDGKYQLYARKISLEGAGLLYQRYLELKQELEEMGMFAREYKQPIPSYVSTLGVVTAPTGAAIQDIRNIARRRNPGIQIILYPALVQGEGAKESIVRGIQMLDAYGVDVIIVGRGGGSIEDLWAFNEEEVARAVFACHTPVISAVGHETDTTITDYVADLRAPTPSAAAELAVYDYKGLAESLGDYRRRFRREIERRLLFMNSCLEGYETRFKYLSPQNQIREKRQYLADLQENLEDRMEQKLSASRHRLALSLERMKGLSPLNKLNQGYSYVSDEKGRNVRSVNQVSLGDQIRIQMADGEIYGEIKTIRKTEGEIFG